MAQRPQKVLFFALYSIRPHHYLGPMAQKLQTIISPLPLNGYPVPQLSKALSVVASLANEQGNILPLVREITEALARIPNLDGSYEIVFVDDASTDGTRDEVMEAMRLNPEVRLIQHGGRYGKSQGIRTATRHARGEWIATLDGDGQSDPADIPKLLARAWQNGRDKSVLVSGVRVNRKDTWGKRMASKFANALRRALLGDDSPDTGCPLKIFRRDAYLALPYFDGLHRYEPAFFRLYGHEVVYMPVNDRPRGAGISKYTNMKRALVGIYDLMGVMWLQRRFKARLDKASEVVPLGRAESIEARREQGAA